MKYLLLFVLAAALGTTAFSQQQETLGVLTYNVPAGWTKDVRTSSVVYSITNKKTRGWCQIAIYQQTVSKGSIDADFNSEWTELVVPLGVTAPPQLSEVQEFDGWKIQNGSGSFQFNGSTSSNSLTVISGYNIRLSVLVNTNTTDYAQVAYDFLANLQLSAPSTEAAPVDQSGSGQQQSGTGPVQTGTGQQQTGQGITSQNTEPTTSTELVQVSQQAVKDNFAFNTTNFDDGWVSTVQADWVQVIKGNVKVLLHYAREGTIFPADPDPMTRAAWDILVSPRYTGLSNFKTTYINTYNRPYIGMGSATDKATGQKVYIVFFHQTAGWQEVVTPDRNTFINTFGFDPETIRWDSEFGLLKSLDEMQYRNRFSVASADLEGTGEWNTTFANNTYWSNAYTGTYAGMSTYSSSQWFKFGSGKNYTWQLVAANSGGGVTNVAQAKGAGSFKSVNNWQLYFSSMEGKPKTYDVYFAAVKGGRILYMNDAQYPGSGIFTGFTRKK